MNRFHWAFVSVATIIFCVAVIKFPPISLNQTASTQQSSSRRIMPDNRLVAAQEQNPDTIAWLTVPGTNIDGPVQQASDNEYYLRRNALGQDDYEGCLYADYECNLSEAEKLSTNTVVYGHSFTALGQNQDTGFGELRYYLQEDFAEKYPDIFLSVSDQKLHFSIISVGIADTTQDQVCILANPDSNQFQQLVEKAKVRNRLKMDFSVETGDRLLTLSTCTDNFNQRLLIVAKLASE